MSAYCPFVALSHIGLLSAGDQLEPLTLTQDGSLLVLVQILKNRARTSSSGNLLVSVAAHNFGRMRLWNLPQLVLISTS